MNKTTMCAKDTAKYLGISYYTLLELRKQGKIPNSKIGRKYLFRKDTLDLWLQEQETASVKSEPESVGYGKLRKANA